MGLSGCGSGSRATVYSVLCKLSQTQWLHMTPIYGHSSSVHLKCKSRLTGFLLRLSEAKVKVLAGLSSFSCGIWSALWVSCVCGRIQLFVGILLRSCFCVVLSTGSGYFQFLKTTHLSLLGDLIFNAGSRHLPCVFPAFAELLAWIIIFMNISDSGALVCASSSDPWVTCEVPEPSGELSCHWAAGAFWGVTALMLTNAVGSGLQP